MSRIASVLIPMPLPEAFDYAEPEGMGLEPGDQVAVPLGPRLIRGVVTELRESTYYAELHLVGNGTTHVVSARPSDAIALAARTGTSIFADESVLDEAAYVAEEPAEEEENEVVVEQFKEFIDRVNPEDFAS